MPKEAIRNRKQQQQEEGEKISWGTLFLVNVGEKGIN